MKRNFLLCFDHKKGKIMVKRTNLKWITPKKSETLFHKEHISPDTLYLKATFSPVALYKKKDRSESLPWQEQITLFEKSSGSELLLLLFL